MISINTGRLFLVIVISGIMFSCRLDVPIQEMTQARAAIAKARLVMSEKYAPESLDKSIQELYTSHDFLAKQDTSGAKKSAEASLSSALAAINASLPFAAEDSLLHAKVVYQEADRLLAENFASEQFAAAKTNIDEAEKHKNDKKFYDSFMKSREAAAKGSEAKALSLEKVPQLTENINKIKMDINDLKTLALSDAQKQELAADEGKLDNALQLVSQQDLKQAVPMISEAQDSFIKIQAAVTKKSAKDRIAELRKEMETLKKVRGTEQPGEDIDGVISILNEADSLVESDRMDEAWIKISDAEKSIADIRSKTLKPLAMEKSKSVGKLLEDTKAMDTQNKFGDQIATASGIYAEGKDLLDGEYYAESLAKFEEAESVLKSLSVAQEKGNLGKEGMKSLEGKRVYKVIYNRAKRDCLWRIALKVYKRARLWPLIYMANKDQIKDPDLIFPGQTFMIPEIPEKGKIEFMEKKEGAQAPGENRNEMKKTEPATGEKAGEK
jgi:nucleoid-associated protein YgaU